MTPQEIQRELFIKSFSQMLRDFPFSMTYKVKKRPEGIKIVVEVTQEEMDEIINKRMSK